MRKQALASRRKFAQEPRSIFGPVLIIGLIILLIVSFSSALDNSPTLREAPASQEDESGWECDEHGNGICGPISGQADSEGIMVSDPNGPVLWIEWSEIEGME